MKKLLFFFILYSQFGLAAGSNTVFSVNSSFADKSISNLISIQPTFKNAFRLVDVDLSLDTGRFRNQVNYNESVEDFTIEKILVAGSLDVTWNKILTLGFGGSNENINKGEVKVLGVTSKARLRIDDFAARATLTDRYIRQITDFYIGVTESKERLTLRSNRQSYSLSYYGLEAFSFSLSYSKYTYDTDVTNANALFSTKTVLNKNGASFLSQIYSLIDHELTLDTVYNLSESLDLELMFGNSVDLLDPNTKSNEFRLGATYYFKQFSLGGGLTNVRPEDTDEPLYSGDLTLSYEF